MDLRLLGVLSEQLGGHQCSPQYGCGAPHYLDKSTAPHYLERWPEYSRARAKVEEVRDYRELLDEILESLES